jgi:multisubunit Na+/H+ antiporter MnhE subunit
MAERREAWSASEFVDRRHQMEARSRPNETRARPVHFVRVWLAWWAALVVVWLLLVDTFATDELVVGAAASAISASVATAVHRRGYIRFWPRAVWLREVPSLLWETTLDCGRLTDALWRRVVRREPVHGETFRVAFHQGGDNGRDGARRALVNFAVSFTPNSYVVDIDPEGDSLLVHRLVAAPLDAILRREQERAAAITDPPRGDDT